MIDDISIDNIAEILLNLDVCRDLFSAFQVNTTFAKVCRSESFWRLRTLRYYPDDFSQKPKNITYKDFYIDISNPWRLRILRYYPDDLNHKPKNITYKEFYINTIFYRITVRIPTIIFKVA